VEELSRCKYCGTRYHFRKSTSWSLKMQFCSREHERAFNGCTIEDIFAVERFPFSFVFAELAGRIGE